MTHEQSEKKYSSFQLIRDLYSYLEGQRWRFLLGSLIRLASDLSWLFPAYALSETLNFLSSYKQGESTDYIEKLFAIWIILSCVRYWGSQISKGILYQIGEKGGIALSNRVFARLLRADTAWHELENSGNKLKKTQQAASGVDRFVRIWANNLIEISVNFVGMSIILYKKAPNIGLIFVSFIIVNFALSKLLRARAIRAARVAADLEEDFTGLAFEAINNVRTVKVLYAQNELLTRLKDLGNRTFKAIRVRIIRFRQGEVVISTVSQAFRLGGSIFIVIGIIRGKYPVGMFALYYSYFNTVWQSVDELSNASSDMAVSKLALSRIRGLLNAPSLELQADTNVHFPKKWDKIEIQELYFSYGEKNTLNNINFTVNKGEKVGIVGLSGAGKTTLFKLILKEYDSYTGNLSIGNVPVSKIDFGEYFKKIAVVLQDTEVFNFSLRDNITIGKPEASRNNKLLRKAIETAHIENIIEKLPEGIDTLIGEKGVKLSGGERQRLGIARAVFKEPEILLLDEATSHLDVESETEIQNSLHSFFKDVTAIVIAHRLSTLREMDKIVVIEGGKVVEIGSFASLTKKQGRFFELWEKQKI